MPDTLQETGLTPPLVASTLAGSAVVVALFFAALNAIELAGYAAGVAVAFVLLAIIAAVYRRLPAGGRYLVLSQRAVLSSALIAVVLAIALSCAYWYVGWMAWDRLPPGLQELLSLHGRKLDIIPSAFSLILPGGWRSGFHQYFNRGSYCFPGSFQWESMRYLRSAIPGYTVAFFTAILAIRMLVAKARTWTERRRV